MINTLHKLLDSFRTSANPDLNTNTSTNTSTNANANTNNNVNTNREYYDQIYSKKKKNQDLTPREEYDMDLILHSSYDPSPVAKYNSLLTKQKNNQKLETSD